MVGSPRPSETILTIDVSAVVRNWRALGVRLASPSRAAAVLKADGYGLGAAALGGALFAAGCRHFFVAHLGEAIALRAAIGRAGSIFVLNGLHRDEEAEHVAHGIIPVLNDPGQVATWNGYARRLHHRLPAALHVDTGMSRLGLEPVDARQLAATHADWSAIDWRLLLSHLARSEEDVAMNGEQLALFRSICTAWPGIPASFANSSGIFLGAAYHFDVARPGAALYGINPLPGRTNPQESVVMLHAPVLQIRDIPPARSVGYGATYTAARPTRVATIALGYADGWLRSLSGRGHGFWRGRRIDFIGRVSMDLVTLDATDLPDLGPGDRIEVMGPHHPVDAVAEDARTNGYEVLTRLGSRFARHYREADAS